jgi:hypothetical protein
MEEREVRSSQGEVISESPAHVRTMGSDSLHALAPHGLGGSESTTPWGNVGAFVLVSSWYEILIRKTASASFVLQDQGRPSRRGRCLFRRPQYFTADGLV